MRERPTIFTCRILSSRPGFPLNLTDAEKKALQERLTYLKQLGGVVVPSTDDMDKTLGLVVDLPGRMEYELRDIAANDPAVKANTGFWLEYTRPVRQDRDRLEYRRHDKPYRYPPAS